MNGDTVGAPQKLDLAVAADHAADTRRMAPCAQRANARGEQTLVADLAQAIRRDSFVEDEAYRTPEKRVERGGVLLSRLKTLEEEDDFRSAFPAFRETTPHL